MQEASSYRVVLTGDLVAGREPEKVAEVLSRLFKKRPEQIHRLFRGKPHPLKKDFDYAKANALRKRIVEAGAQCVIEPVVQQEWKLEPVADAPATGSDSPGEIPATHVAPGLSLAPAESARPEASIRCPKCGHEQPGGDECEVCGIIFAKYRARSDATGSEPPRARRSAVETPGNADVAPDEWDDLLRFVGPNAEVYAGKFREFGTTAESRFAATWHWPAFFVPFFWAIYRKLWPFAALVWLAAFFTTFMHPLAWLIVNFASGLSANYVYYRQALKKVGNIHRLFPLDSRPAQIAAVGGTSPMAVYIGIGAALLFSLLTWKMALDPLMEQMGEMPAVTRGTSGLSGADLNTPEAQATAIQLSMLSFAVKLVLIKEGSPSGVSWEQIKARMRMSDEDIKDPWGTALRFEPEDSGFELRSAGPDRLFDSDDDLSQRTAM